MLKKAGIMTLGIAAGLVAVAPLASAHEHHDKGHGGSGNIGSCTAGNAEGGAIGGDAFGGALANLGGAAAAAPIGGSLDCNSILNGSLNDNVRDNSVASDNEL
jgi:hypothetical protein